MSSPQRTTPQVLEAIEHLRSGAAMTLSEALRMVGLAHKLFKRALRKTPELVELYEEAIQESYDLLADKLVHITEYYPDPKAANAISRNIQWYLSKKRPSLYGDHSTVEHRITADKDVIEALLRAKARAQTLEYAVASALPHPTRVERIRELEADVIELEVESDDTDITSLL